MDYEHAVERLRNHANMPDAGSGSAESASFLHLLSQADRTKEPVDLTAAYTDIIDCFAALNRVLNTDTPSQRTDGKASWVDRTLVASVALIASDGFSLYSRWVSDRAFPDAYLSDCAEALVRIGFAWSAVLAGDIDDIRGHIEDEWFAYKI